MDKNMSFGHELRNCVIGMFMAIFLSGTAFALVAWSHWPSKVLLVAISICAILQLIVHFRFFLHIDLEKSHRDDLQLILFSGFIIALMVGGTLWIIFNENMRMM